MTLTWTTWFRGCLPAVSAPLSSYHFSLSLLWNWVPESSPLSALGWGGGIKLHFLEERPSPDRISSTSVKRLSWTFGRSATKPSQESWLVPSLQGKPYRSSQANLCRFRGHQRRVKFTKRHRYSRWSSGSYLQLAKDRGFWKSTLRFLMETSSKASWTLAVPM